MPFDQQRENGSQNVVRVYKHRNISTSGGRTYAMSIGPKYGYTRSKYTKQEKQ